MRSSSGTHFLSGSFAAVFIAISVIATLSSCGGGTSLTNPPPPPPPVTATETVLYSFLGSSGANDGYTPTGGPVMDSAGNLYGLTAAGGSGAPALGTLFKLDSSAHETILHSFQQVGNDGFNPGSGLVIDSRGTLYGTTANGGTGAACVGCGTIFKVDSSGNETILYNFTGQNGDGASPNGIISDGSGNFYGVTVLGGSATCWCGTVFKLDSAGNETVLYSFTGQNGDGAFPGGGFGNPLILDNSGNLYGFTRSGGNSGCSNNNGCGTVFKVDPAGHETVLHTFTGPDGNDPISLIMDSAGNLYGTAQGGGTSNNCAQIGCGTVFKISSAGNTTTLHNFAGAQNSDGAGPLALVMDNSGNLYGVTGSGGPSGTCTTIGSAQITGCGTFFKLDTAGHEIILYNFKGLAGSASGDGFGPGTLIRDNAGNFYGITISGGMICPGGNSGCGSVFKITVH